MLRAQGWDAAPWVTDGAAARVGRQRPEIVPPQPRDTHQQLRREGQERSTWMPVVCQPHDTDVGLFWDNFRGFKIDYMV